MRKQPLWTRTAVEFVVESIHHHFGPYRDWENKSFPQGRKAEYHELCTDLAGAILCEPRGVEAIVNMMVFGGWNTRTNLKTRIWAWAKALEIGFMTEEEIPLLAPIGEAAQ